MSAPESRPATRGSRGPRVHDVLAADQRPVPAPFLDESCTDLGVEGIPLSRYLSPEFHDLEVERVWRRVWQMACREEHIPNVGNHVVYDIVDDSLIVIRTGPNEIRAFVNACLHRGRRLRQEGGYVPELRCPFHGFTWNLDGTLLHTPSAWDFPQVDPARFCLPEAQVGTWGGFVFVNMDPAAPTLEEYLEVLPAHFAHVHMEDRYTAAHIAKVVAANWKTCQEAFLESFHVTTTHPQLAGSTADESTQYDVWPGVRHVSRAITLAGLASPFMAASDDEAVLANYVLNREYYGTHLAGRDLVLDEPLRLDGEQSARQVIAARLREQLRPLIGDAAAERASDSEVMDPIAYTVFPNFAPWMAAGPSIVYRFRPNGNDVDSCVVELMFLSPVPEGAERPPPAPVHWLSESQPWTDAVELGRLGPVLNQDAKNLPELQRGMKHLARFGRDTTLSRYQEVRIRHFHQTLTEYVDRA